MTALLIILAALLFVGGFALGYELCHRKRALAIAAIRRALKDTTDALVDANERAFANAVACERAELERDNALIELGTIKRVRSEAGHKAAVTRRANAERVLIVSNDSLVGTFRDVEVAA